MDPSGASLELLTIPLAPTGAIGESSGHASVAELAAAVATSPWWAQMPPTTLVVREGPAPALGILGAFDDADRIRLGWLEQQIREVLPRTVRVTYQEAEDGCDALANRLVAEVGRDRLRRLAFRGIPRGGLIVLGMLSYLLDLDQDQLERPVSGEGPLIVVDDCILTGNRLLRYLNDGRATEVIVASLHSTPDVRGAILERERRVSACFSAFDLRDRSDEVLGPDAPAWRDRWHARSGDRTYWTGMPEHVCYPWSEPDLTFWNERTGREERGWPLVPSSRCLAHRGRNVSTAPDVQVQPPGRGPIEPAPDAMYGMHGDRVVVADIRTGTSVILEGVAMDMWRSVIAHGTIADACTELARMYDVGEDTLGEDLMRFVDRLAARGLLVRVPPDDGH